MKMMNVVNEMKNPIEKIIGFAYFSLKIEI